MPQQHHRTGSPSGWAPLTNDRGALLIEAVVAITVFVTIFTVTMVAISTALKSSQNLEQRAIAENIVRNQLEWIVSQPYSGPTIGYTATTTPSDYIATITTDNLNEFPADDDIERITVTVTRDGGSILSIETIRTRFSDEDGNDGT